jgi:hypothetical protein
VGWFVFSAVPVLAQGTPGPGKAELAIVPGGWVSFLKPDALPEPAFSEYLIGVSITFNPGPIGIEGGYVVGLKRTQKLEYGSTVVTKKSPPVFIDTVNLIVPLMGNHRPVVPFVTAGIGEVTINRTRDVGQVDTETFFAGNFGGGVKWYSEGRWGFRGDYRYSVSRSEFGAPGNFFGRERRESHRFYAGLIVNLIRP